MITESWSDNNILWYWRNFWNLLFVCYVEKTGIASGDIGDFTDADF